MKEYTFDEMWQELKNESEEAREILETAEKLAEEEV